MRLHSLVRDYLLGPGNALGIVTKARWTEIDEEETKASDS